MSRPPRPLAQRLAVPMVVVVLTIAGASGFMRVRAVERGLHETMLVGADQLSRSITSATWHAMLADDRQTAYDVMQAVARQPGISQIRIYNKEGRIMFSTSPEAGRVVDKKAEACVLCHASAQPLVRVETPTRARIFRGADGGRRLAMITPIYNEPACTACHARSQNVLGVLDVSMDLGAVDRLVAATRTRILVSTGLEVVAISISLALLVGAFVTRPIHRLIDATSAVGRMDLDRAIEIRSSRELWDLARSFNAMRERLREALSELSGAAQQLEAKVAERTEQLRQAHQRLLQADRLASLGQLAASVAHEINNPLSGVLNFAALMQRILRDDGVPPNRLTEFRSYLDRVTEQTARVGRIVSDLLAFSRRAKPHRAPADLNALVRSTVDVVSHKLKLMNVALEMHLDPELPLVPCDASQLQQVVLNLVMNGAEATRGHGAGHVTVRTRCAPERAAVSLVVEDDGEGMPEESLARIFDPFFTTKEDGKGVGLGLAVVYGIVESHAGQVDVKSAVGKGSAFEVTLPLAPNGAKDALEDGSSAPHEA